MTTKHNHGSNFGRHVNGCPRCEELKAGAKPVVWARNTQKTIDWSAHKASCVACKAGRVCTYGEW